jgi:Tfp pilus assembly protein FimT
LVLLVAILGLVSAIAFPPVSAWLDRLAVIRAVEGFRGFYNTARMGAIYRSSRVRIVIGPDSLVAIAEGRSDSILVVAQGPASHGVALEVSRSPVRLYPTGIGLGAANTTVTLRRGAVSETFTLSRLGRLRRLR